MSGAEANKQGNIYMHTYRVCLCHKTQQKLTRVYNECMQSGSARLMGGLRRTMVVVLAVWHAVRFFAVLKVLSFWDILVEVSQLLWCCGYAFYVHVMYTKIISENIVTIVGMFA